MQYENLNIDALKSSIALLFGDQAPALVQKTYTALASGMERAEKAGFQRGYDAGYEQAEGEHDVIAMANDGTLAEIENQMAAAEMFDADQFAMNGEYNSDNVQDSGDEQPEYHEWSVDPIVS